MKRWIVFTILAIACACSYAEQLPLTEGIVRFKANEDRINTFVNAYGNYTTSGSVAVKTLPQYMSDMTTAGLRYETVALMEADTGQANGAHCLVYDAVDPADNGYYMWTTGSPGAWTYLGWFPSEAIDLPLTTHANETGIIYKDTTRFIHNFNYGANGTVTTNGYNTFVGVGTGNFTMGATATAATESSYNSVLGANSFVSNTTGYHNTVVGNASMYYNTTGYHNTAVGADSLANNTTGYRNIAVGSSALYNNVDGYNNIAMGYGALSTATTGNSNIAIGTNALLSSTGGNYNIGIGYQALMSNTTGTQNVGVGNQSIASNLSGSDNSALGYYSLYANTTGTDNTAIGDSALYHSDDDSYNTAIGSNALANLTTGDYNVAIGYNAGKYINAPDNNTDSTRCIFIGYGARPTAISHTNEIVIGSTAIGNGSNSVTIGNTSITKTVLRSGVGIGNTTAAYPLEVTGTTKSDGLILATVAKSTAYTATAADYTILVSDDTTITLPAAASNTGRVYVIKKVDTAGTTTIIDANSTETIDGDETVSLTTQYSFRMIQCTGTGWTIIGRY